MALLNKAAGASPSIADGPLEAHRVEVTAQKSDVVPSKSPSASNIVERASASPCDAAKAESPKHAAPKKQQKHLIR
jgi:hypothetical protein